MGNAKNKEVANPALKDVDSTTKASKGKTENEGKAEMPTTESVTQRLGINHPFYKKVSDALEKLGLIKKYNPETKEGDVIGGYVQSDSKGGFASGDMYFKADGSISYIKDGVIVEFDKNGNVISENTKQAAAEKVKYDIEGRKSAIKLLEETRDSEDFKYKTVTEFDAIGNRKKVRRLKTAEELKESTDKINAQIDKAKSELSEIEKKQLQPTSAPTPNSKGEGTVTPNVEDWSRDVESTAKALDGKNVSDLSKLVGIEPSEKISDSEDFETATKAILTEPNKGIANLMLGKETEIDKKQDVHTHTYQKTGKTLNWDLSVYENSKGQKRYVLYERKYPEQIDAAALVDKDGKVLQITTSKDFRKIGLAQTLLKEVKSDIGKIIPSEPISKAGKKALDNFAKSQISESYHKAKADGSNPELVKAVEELLGQKQSPSVQVGEAVVESEQAIEALKDVESTAKALEGLKEFKAESDRYFEYVPIEEIEKYKEFDRATEKKWGSVDNTLEELVDDIQKNGIKTPITLQVDRNNNALVVEGNTRLAAAKKLGIKNIPVRIISGEFGSINKSKAKKIGRKRDLGEMKVFYPDVNILNQKNSPAKFGFTSITNTKNISEAYHKAKADGSNPELVKAVEDLLGKPKAETPNVEDWSKDVESTEKALEGSGDGFTTGMELNRIFAASKEKYGEKKGAIYNEVTNRLVTLTQTQLLKSGQMVS